MYFNRWQVNIKSEILNNIRLFRENIQILVYDFNLQVEVVQ